MARTVQTTIARTDSTISIVKHRADGTARETVETVCTDSGEWHRIALGAASDRLALALTRESAARTGSRMGRSVAAEYLGQLDTRGLLAGVLGTK